MLRTNYQAKLEEVKEYKNFLLRTEQNKRASKYFMAKCRKRFSADRK